MLEILKQTQIMVPQIKLLSELGNVPGIFSNTENDGRGGEVKTEGIVQGPTEVKGQIKLSHVSKEKVKPIV